MRSYSSGGEAVLGEDFGAHGHWQTGFYTADGARARRRARATIGPPPMNVNYIVLAIPVFFLLIGIELAGRPVPGAGRLPPRTTPINDLVLRHPRPGRSRCSSRPCFFAGYLFLYDHHRLWSVPGNATWAWVACFLGVDFLYYWFHRWSHEVNAVWAAHVVHHQSEEYNLTVALRQGAFQGAFSWVFYLPLALARLPAR